MTEDVVDSLKHLTGDFAPRDDGGVQPQAWGGDRGSATVYSMGSAAHGAEDD